MLPDISDLYASWQDSHEQEDIPDWAPRSALGISQKEEAVLTRMEKQIGRVLNYGEALKVVIMLRMEVPTAKRFIERVRKCPDCGRWHTDDINRYGMCADCIPF